MNRLVVTTLGTPLPNPKVGQLNSASKAISTTKSLKRSSERKDIWGVIVDVAVISLSVLAIVLGGK